MRTLIILLQLAACGSDDFYTHRNIAAHLSELNPIAKPFVFSTRGQVAYFAGTAGIKILIPVALRRYHHRKLAWASAGGMIADNAGCAAYSATHFTKGERERK